MDVKDVKAGLTEDSIDGGHTGEQLPGRVGKCQVWDPGVSGMRTGGCSDVGALSPHHPPNSLAKAIASSGLAMGWLVPGTTATPHAMAARRAAVLSPMASIVSGSGPTKVMPASAHLRANVAFSDRNP